MLQQVFPLIQRLLSRWLHDSEVVEVQREGGRLLMFLLRMICLPASFPSLPLPPHQAVCTVFEKSVRTLLHDFGPMVAQLSGMLGQIYSAFPQAAALDLARQV